MNFAFAQYLYIIFYISIYFLLRNNSISFSLLTAQNEIPILLKVNENSKVKAIVQISALHSLPPIFHFLDRPFLVCISWWYGGWKWNSDHNGGKMPISMGFWVQDIICHTHLRSLSFLLFFASHPCVLLCEKISLDLLLGIQIFIDFSEKFHWQFTISKFFIVNVNVFA